MKKIFFILFFIAFSASIFAQIGRVVPPTKADSAAVGIDWFSNYCDTCFFEASQTVFKTKVGKSNFPITPTMQKDLSRLQDNKLKAAKIELSSSINLKADQSALNTEIVNRTNAEGNFFVKGDTLNKLATKDNINYVQTQTTSLEANKANKSDLSIGAGNVYYVDNSRWKNAGETRGGTIYTAQLNAAKRGSIIYSYPTIWAARNAALVDSATIAEPVICVMGGTHTVGMDTAINSAYFDYAVPVAKKQALFQPSDLASACLNYKRISYYGTFEPIIRVVNKDIRLMRDEYNNTTFRRDSFFFKGIGLRAVGNAVYWLRASSIRYESESDSIGTQSNNMVSFGSVGQSSIKIGQIKSPTGYFCSAFNNAGGAYPGVNLARPLITVSIGSVFVDSSNQNHNYFMFGENKKTVHQYKVGNFSANETDGNLVQAGWYGQSWATLDSTIVNIEVENYYQRRLFSGTYTLGLFDFKNATTNKGNTWNFQLKNVDCESPLFANSNNGQRFVRDSIVVYCNNLKSFRGKNTFSEWCNLGESDENSTIILTGNYNIKDWTTAIVIPPTFLGKVILDNCYIKSSNDIPLITNNSASAKVILRNTTLVVGGAATNSITGTGSVIVESARSNAPVSGTVTQLGNTVSVNSAFNY